MLNILKLGKNNSETAKAKEPSQTGRGKTGAAQSERAATIPPQPQVDMSELKIDQTLPKGTIITDNHSPKVSELGLNTSSQATNETNLFDHRISDIFTEEVAAADTALKSSLLSPEEFRESFIGLHGMGAAITGLKSLELPNGRINKQTADEVADTIYETILDIPMLQFMLNKEGKWLGRAFIMFVYVQGMRGAVAEEIAAKLPPKPTAQNQAAPQAQPSKDGSPSAEQAAALGAA